MRTLVPTGGCRRYSDSSRPWGTAATSVQTPIITSQRADDGARALGAQKPRAQTDRPEDRQQVVAHREADFPAASHGVTQRGEQAGQREVSAEIVLAIPAPLLHEAYRDPRRRPAPSRTPG